MKTNRILIYLSLIFIVGCGTQKKIRTTQKKTSAHQSNTLSKRQIEKKEEEKLEATSFVTVTFENVEEYISWFKNTAISNMMHYKIPASIILAQGILESGAGKGELCKKANNHFGIKCHVGWQGDMVFHDDDTAQECFRKYNHPAESYKDHSLFLTSRERYKKLFSLDPGDYKSWAQGLKDAGYATDPKYPAKLIHIIEKYKLSEIDMFVLGYDFNKKASLDGLSNTNITLSNNSQEHTIEKGDTLYSLSKKYKISVDDLKRLNKLKNETLSIGQILKIK